jgi:hypothetical protein
MHGDSGSIQLTRRLKNMYFKSSLGNNDWWKLLLHGARDFLSLVVMREIGYLWETSFLKETKIKSSGKK